MTQPGTNRAFTQPETAPMTAMGEFFHERRLKIEREVVAALKVLEDAGIDYCLLAPSQTGLAPEQKDVDVFIAPGSLATFDGYLLKAGWRLEGNSRFSRVRRFYQKIIWGFRAQFDVSLGYYVHAARETYAYKGAVTPVRGDDGFRYLPDEVALSFILKKSLVNGKMSPDKLAIIDGIAARPAWWPGNGEAVIASLRSNRGEVDARFRAITPGGSMCGYWQARVVNWLVPSHARLAIAVVGLDGAGKSTITTRLARQLESDGLRQRLCYFGHSAHRLAVLRWLAAASQVKVPSLVRKARSFLYLLAIPMEFLLRRGVGGYDVLIMDRHPLAEPVFPGEGVSLYDRFLRAFVPKPDVVLYLTGDSELIWKRKQEHSYEVYRDMGIRLERALAHGIEVTRVCRVDCSPAPDEVFANCHEIVARLITHRPSRG